MKAWAKWAIALMAGIVAAVAARQLVATVFVVRGNGMSPTFVAGDRVLVNRWSYGLRTGGSGTLFSYGRLLRQKVSIGDYIAYEDPRDNTGSTILFGRCQALPGDTLTIGGKPTAVPSLKHCADADCYYVTPPGQDRRSFPDATQRSAARAAGFTRRRPAASTTKKCSSGSFPGWKPVSRGQGSGRSTAFCTIRPCTGAIPARRS